MQLTINDLPFSEHLKDRFQVIHSLLDDHDQTLSYDAPTLSSKLNQLLSICDYLHGYNAAMYVSKLYTTEQIDYLNQLINDTHLSIKHTLIQEDKGADLCF